MENEICLLRKCNKCLCIKQPVTDNFGEDSDKELNNIQLNTSKTSTSSNDTVVEQKQQFSRSIKKGSTSKNILSQIEINKQGELHRPRNINKQVVGTLESDNSENSSFQAEEKKIWIHVDRCKAGVQGEAVKKFLEKTFPGKLFTVDLLRREGCPSFKSKNKVNELNVLLDDAKPDIVCINEHWLCEHDISVYMLDNYSLISFSCREITNRGGDVNIASIDKHFEYSCAEVVTCHFKVIIISIYRPPSGDIDIFLESMSQLLDKVYKVKRYHYIVCGDFNLNFAKLNDSTTKLLNIFKTYGLESHITAMTRITPVSGTCIDNVFSDFTEGNYFCQVIKADISDHYPLIFEFMCSKSTKPTITSKRRRYNSNSLVNFYSTLIRESWHEVYVADESSTKKYNNWITTDIKQQSQYLRDLYALYKQTGCENVHIKYKNEKKSYRKSINDKKKAYNDNIIIGSRNRTKSAWSLVNRVKGKSPNTSKIEELNVNGIKVASPHKIANEFANHFSNNNRPIGVNSQPDSIKLKGIHTKNLFFKPTASHEVLILSKIYHRSLQRV
nr:unnamed protein product [Callosobruchus analis]